MRASVEVCSRRAAERDWMSLKGFGFAERVRDERAGARRILCFFSGAAPPSRPFASSHDHVRPLRHSDVHRFAH